MHITCDFHPKERILGNLLLIILYSWVRRVVPIFNILIQLTKPSQAHLRNEMFQYVKKQMKLYLSIVVSGLFGTHIHIFF